MAEWPRLDVPSEEERIIRFRPGYHRCHTDPSRNYGIAGTRMVWVLKVGENAVSWDVTTDWAMPKEAFLAACPDCTHPMHADGYPRHKADGGAVDWHLARPAFEDAAPSAGVCPVIGAPCYPDVGYLLGSELFDLLNTEGDEAVWSKLRELLDDHVALCAELATR